MTPPLDAKQPWTGMGRASLLGVVEELIGALKATTGALEATADQLPSQDDETERAIMRAREVLERYAP